MVLSPKARLAGCLALAPFMLAIWFAVVSREGRTVHASPAGRTIQLGTAQAGAAYAVTISIKNPAQVQEIAELIAFFASDKASYLTGAGIPVDSGRTAI